MFAMEGGSRRMEKKKRQESAYGCVCALELEIRVKPSQRAAV